MHEEIDYERRFGGIARLYGAQAFTQFTQSHVCVIGLGGVGSWVAEALARSGIGELTLIDLDQVSESNINRQLVALDSTLGKAKAQVLVERIADINPSCIVHPVEDFIEKENLLELIHSDFSYVIDCIDSFRVKSALIAYCRRQKINLITMGGTGGKIDPTLLQIADLSRTLQDSLLARTRKELRQNYNFPRNPKRRFSVPAVYSPEHFRQAKIEKCSSAANSSSHLNCGGLGSVTHVTASAGFFAVSYVLKKLADVCVR